ncbi:DUF4291 domain-containing protein [Luteolibacter sp. Populi]|uniref:DUF4291 domain-containing protein n=1 Tax=Luteolibacter sp. Populi TaxID=3230487 RepID=UPI0034678B96
MKVAPYIDVAAVWPSSGRHILASHDEDSIVVYQAYRPAIGRYAAMNGHFGGEFSFSRMSWIKPNFLWMMYRSGWGTKEGQEVILAVTIPRRLFEEILVAAVPSAFDASKHRDTDSWKGALAASEVRLQWDPDHGPNGAPQQRRAIQLGLRGEMLRRYAETEVIRIEDISGFVAEQREFLGNPDKLLVPAETVYQPDVAAAANVALDPFDLGSAT